MQFNSTLRTARAGLIGSTLGSDGTLVIYTGAAPGIGNSPTGTLLATLTGLTFASASGGAITFTATADSSAAASGTPGYGRLKTSGGTAIIEFSCGVGSGDASFDATISMGSSVTLVSGTITEGNP
jgi:hypothetical protein